MKLAQVIRQTCDTMGVRFDDARRACERALVAAAEEVYGDARTFEAHYDAASDALTLRLFMEVVETIENPNTQLTVAALEAAGVVGVEVGEDAGFEVFYLPEDRAAARDQDAQFGALLGLSAGRERFGRIAIHQAKQALIRALRDAERAAVCDAYEPLVAHLVPGIVDKVGRHDHVTVSLGGGVQGLLPRDQQHPRDRLVAGDWVWVEVLGVSREDGPPLTLTRTGEGVVRHVLAFQVHEVAEGQVVVEGVAREAGGRCKVAVRSKRDDVNPVAVCVGERGANVQAVVQALTGDRVDIVPWDADPLAQGALALGVPVVDVLMDAEGVSFVVVAPEDMPLAVGRGGENLRLARRLAGVEFQVVAEAQEVMA